MVIDTARHHRGSSTHEAAGSRAGVPNYLRPAAQSPGPEDISIQRDPDGPLPSFPHLQLTPPSLLKPRDPYERFRFQFAQQLQLDPALQARMESLLRTQLDPTHVQSLAGSSGAAGGTGVTPTSAASGAPASAPATTATPSAPAATTTPPLDAPPVATPRRAGEAGDVLSAVTALPQVSTLMNSVRDQALSRLSLTWSGTSTLGRVGMVSGGVFIAGSILGPVLGFKGPRDTIAPLLSDVVLPIPGLNGYALEYQFRDGGVGVGVHVDLGQYLPTLWGFGPASLTSFKDQARDLSLPPLNRKAEAGADASGGTAAAGVGSAIRAASGRGAPIPASMRESFGTGLNADLSQVRIHHDAQADSLARSVHARAFTTGQDVFFRAGSYDPASHAGQHLLAHELAHTVQQAQGPVAGQAVGGGLNISLPQDQHERDADKTAEALLARR